MSKKHKGGDHGEIHADERWLITYADMITLLLAVFIVMYALSDTNLRKFNAFAQSLSSAFNTDVFSGSLDVTVTTGQESAPETGDLDSGGGIVGSEARDREGRRQRLRDPRGPGRRGQRGAGRPRAIAIRIRSHRCCSSPAAPASRRARYAAPREDRRRRPEHHAGPADPGRRPHRRHAHQPARSTPTTSSCRPRARCPCCASSASAGIASERMSVEGAGEYEPRRAQRRRGATGPANRRVDILILYPPTASPARPRRRTGDAVPEPRLRREPREARQEDHRAARRAAGSRRRRRPRLLLRPGRPVRAARDPRSRRRASTA